MKIIKILVIPSLNAEVMQKLYRNEIFVQISCLTCFFLAISRMWDFLFRSSFFYMSQERNYGTCEERYLA